MRIAALYDVHGNVHALEAVLADVRAVDTILFGGDIAAGPFPRETLDVVRPLDDIVGRTGYDVERADAAIRASGHPLALDFVDRATAAQWFATAS